MIESNNKKTFICVSFYTADGKLCKYENIFYWEIWKLGQIDSIREAGIGYQKPGLSQQNWDSWNVGLPS